ncbi:MAG: glycosyltransferase family 1 protein [Gemmatimonadaceae bacterium]
MSAALRVLYCTDTYEPQVNGVSVVTALSAHGLRSRGWECAVVAPRYPKARTRVDVAAVPSDPLVTRTSVASAPLPFYPEVRLAAPSFLAVRRAVRDFRPDLVHCQTEFVIGRMGQIAAQHAGIPLVSSYHTDFAKYTKAYGAGFLRRGVSAYLGRFHRRSRRVYTPSAPARADLMRSGLDNVEVWGRGVETDTFHPSRRSRVARAARGFGGAFGFLYVGRLAAEKGVDVILDAYRLATRLVPSGAIKLVIAGAGPSEEALRRSAPADVAFLGYLDRQTALPQLFASADAFVFASLTETLGLVVLEAMASGLPVIATPAGGVADHLRDGVNGLAYPARNAEALAHAMVALALDRGRAAALGAAARQTAELLDWEREIDRLDVSYREVCAQLSPCVHGEKIAPDAPPLHAAIG